MPRLQGQQLGPEAAASGLLHIAVQPAHAPTEEAAKRARSLLAGMQVLHSSDSFLCCICRVPCQGCTCIAILRCRHLPACLDGYIAPTT